MSNESTKNTSGSGISIGQISGNIHGSVIAGRDVSVNIISRQVPLQRPPRVQPFFNYEHILTEIITTLGPGKTVMLYGPGGVGKTAVVSEVVWRLTPNDSPSEIFPDGIIYYSFYQQPKIKLALEHIASSFEEELQPNPIEAARRTLVKRQALIILDGAEMADDLSKLLEIQGMSGLLVAGRQPNDLFTKRFEIKSLSKDSAEALMRTWSETGAVNNLEFEKLYELLGGLPLAWTMVGRYLTATGSDIADVLDLLQTPPYPELEQKRWQWLGISQLLEKSILQLSKGAKQGLSVVGALAPTWFERAVVAEAYDMSISQVNEWLEELRNFGFLQKSGRRYSVRSPLIHSYIQEQYKLEVEIVERLAGYYIALFEEQNELKVVEHTLLSSPSTHATTILRLCVDQKIWGQALRLAQVLECYFDLNDRHIERQLVIEHGLNVSRLTQNETVTASFVKKMGDIHLRLLEYGVARIKYEEALSVYVSINDQSGQASSIRAIGDIHLLLAEYEQARQRYEEARPIYTVIGDRLGEANCIRTLGDVHLRQSEYKQARQHYEEARPIYAAVGSRLGEANCIQALGDVHLRLDELEQARRRYDEARSVYSVIGDRLGEANCIQSLGDVHLRLDELEQARTCFEEARPIYAAIDNRLGEANCIKALGDVYLRLKDYDAARIRYEQAKPIYAAINNRLGEANCIQALGDVYLRLNDYEAARIRYEEAKPIYVAIGDRLGEANCIQALGDIRLQLEEYDSARTYFEEARSIYAALGARYNLAASLARLGLTYNYLAQLEQVVEYYHQALIISREIESRIIEEQVLNNLGVAYSNLGQTENALDYYRQALDITFQNQEFARSAEILILMGNLAYDNKEFDQARQFWTESRDIYRKIGSPLVSSAEALLDELKTVRQAPLTLEETVQSFFGLAGFELSSGDKGFAFLCRPKDRIWRKKFSQPIPMAIASGLPLDSERVQNLFQIICQTLDNAPSVIFIVIDHAPTDDGWLQIATLRAKNVQIIPIDDSILHKGQEEGRQRQTLDKYLRRFTGSDRDLYNVRDPVADRLNFFGREVLATEIVEDLNEGRPLAIFGLRKMGKSSLLNYLRDNLPFPTALVDLQTGTELTDLYQRMLNSWESSLRVKQKVLTWFPPKLTESPNSSVAFSAAAHELLDRFEEQSLLPRLGILIDEVDVIFQQSKHGIENYLSFSRMLRGLVQEEDRISLMVAGVDPSLNRTNRIGGQQNPFYQFFREIYLPALNLEDCKQMIRNIGRQMGLVYSDEAASFVATVTGGHPFLARQLCSLAFRQLGGPGEVPLEYLHQVAIRFIREPGTAELLDEKGLWGEVIDPHVWPQAQIVENERVLTTLAQVEPQPEATLVSYAQNRRACERSLDELERRAILGKPETDSFDINLRLFRNWIRRYKLGEV